MPEQDVRYDQSYRAAGGEKALERLELIQLEPEIVNGKRLAAFDVNGCHTLLFGFNNENIACKLYAGGTFIKKPAYWLSVSATEENSASVVA